MLSKYQLQIKIENNFSPGKNKELIPNLDNKRKYKLHYKTLFKKKIIECKNSRTIFKAIY